MTSRSLCSFLLFCRPTATTSSHCSNWHVNPSRSIHHCLVTTTRAFHCPPKLFPSTSPCPASIGRRWFSQRIVSARTALPNDNNFQHNHSNNNNTTLRFQQYSTSNHSSSLTQIRLNKVFKATHSRREADRLIEQGRVKVNGKTSKGDMVIPYSDVITLDGNVVDGWERMNGILPGTTASNTRIQPTTTTTTKTFEYIKYYKPKGVTCTTDTRVKGNIMDALMKTSGYQPKHRIFPVGRLDRDSSGLILFTSDGRVTNSTLKGQHKQPKVYHVRIDRRISDFDLKQLRSGVVITSVTKHDGTQKSLTAKTKPCTVTLLGPKNLEIILEEGRNRQIRKMMSALGYEVVDLHRIRFGKISLDKKMSPGDWKILSSKEMQWIQSILPPKPLP